MFGGWPRSKCSCWKYVFKTKTFTFINIGRREGRFNKRIELNNKWAHYSKRCLQGTTWSTKPIIRAFNELTNWDWRKSEIWGLRVSWAVWEALNGFKWVNRVPYSRKWEFTFIKCWKIIASLTTYSKEWVFVRCVSKSRGNNFLVKVWALAHQVDEVGLKFSVAHTNVQ